MRRGGYVRECDWTSAEVAQLRAEYSKGLDAPVNLKGLAQRLGRDRHNVCRKARSLGLTNQKRPKVLERKKRTRMFDSQEERRAYQSRITKERLAKNGHPRGALGMKHSKATLELISKKAKAAWADPASGHNSEEATQRRSDLMVERISAGGMNHGYSRAKGGRREDLDNRYFRSAWEANYARYLNFLVKSGEICGWEYEPRTFEFVGIKRGVRLYTPDFLVKLTSGAHEWHEVKGWMDQKSKTRLKRFAKYFPSEKLIVVDHKWFKSASRNLAPMIKGWEKGTVR